MVCKVTLITVVIRSGKTQPTKKKKKKKKKQTKKKKKKRPRQKLYLDAIRIALIMKTAKKGKKKEYKH
jgi:hypothetical protein